MIRIQKINILMISVIIFSFVSCNKNVEVEKKDDIQAVKTTRPDKRQFARTFDTASMVKANQTAYINPLVAGTIKKFYVKEGDRVKKNQPLARLDDTDYRIAVDSSQAQLAAAKAAVLQAEAAFNTVRSNFERFKELKESGSISSAEYEKVESGYQQAKAGFDAAKAQKLMAESALRGNKRKLGHTIIRAPFSGFVAAQNGEVGEMAAPSSPRPMFEIIQSNTLKIDVFISELEISGISEKSVAEVFFDAFPGLSEKAAVSFINSKVNPSTKSVQVELSLDNKDNRYKPGMTVRVRITLPEKEHLVIPRNAVFTRDNEAGIVYVRKKDDTVFIKNVILGGTVDGYSIISSGLSGNEEIVVGGGRRLEEGQKVRVIGTVSTSEKKED